MSLARERRGVMSRKASMQPRPSHFEVRHHLGFIGGEAVLLVLLGTLAVDTKRQPGPLPGDVRIELNVQHALLPHIALRNALETLSTLNWPVPILTTQIRRPVHPAFLWTIRCIVADYLLMASDIA